MKKIIGERIRKIRQGKDYTQDNMAAELDITAGAYAKIERGETDPSATRLLKIAEILEVDVAIFFKPATPAIAKVEEPITSYGYASKHDVDNLTQIVRQLIKEVEKLKSPAAPVKKIAAKKKSK